MRKNWRWVIGFVIVALTFVGLLVTGPPAGALQVCTITGTSGDDPNLTGTAGNDVICGLGGNDTIRGLGGNDIIYGGPGADKLFGGDGTDALNGEDGNDWIDGENGTDTINGGTGNDYAEGGPSADKLFGGDGTDALNGEDGNDWLSGDGGTDTRNGGEGIDYCSSDSADVSISCFFDSSAPQLISVAISPASVNTGAAAQTITVRARVKDTGTGLKAIYMQFNGPSNTSFVGQWYESNNAYSCANPNRTEGGCRISGTALDGIYEMKINLPKSTRAGTWTHNYFSGEDLAGNRNDWFGDTLTTKNLAVSFRNG